MKRTKRLTKLHTLLVNKVDWDDATRFQVQRYLMDNLSWPGMLTFVDLAGCELGGKLLFKTDAVKLLHERSPNEVLHAWNRWRERR